ncbi:CusA/CzcA family heavy metal efflux RND transporter [Pelagicoccus sp. SDUM812005]|uniref:efflux RND transporter permease subunit n=1 Tax=Pelagicoccus sp. SDUM812005 TaxID=3041257 RepID=UPI00280CAE3E|nr:CusA/CzcA family heavy metal efflux RND transporter [Pelagicoccus sp. SDUM812005]MDQ8180376.1 CusA/CzcA family heavy metal efflux RND transporter [Pelagicoccus sp. SDUM812005]
MLSKLVEFSLKNRLLIALLFAAVSVIGIWRLSMLPIDAFPDTTPVQVQINTVAPSLNPEEIEQQITLPIELSIGGLPGLSNVRSVSKFGFSQVVATFDDETQIIDARQYVFERINSVELPDGIERPQLGPIATGLGEVFHYVVRSDNPERTLEELRTLHDWVVKPELRKVSGVAEVNSWGGEVRQYHVVVSPAALLKFNLTLDDVYEALETNNSNVGGGVITSSGVSQLVHGIGRVTNIEQIENIVIDSFDGNPIRVRDIAEEVKIDREIRRGAVTADGRGEAVLGLAFMLMGENSQEVTENLKQRLDQVRPALPDDVILEVVYDRTELTTSVIDTVKHNLFLGAVLVILVLFLLLGNFRAGLLVAFAIPLAMLLAILGMYEFAIAASLLSLGAIDFGIIIDGSVVMTEANLRNLSQKSQQLGRPLTASERLQTILESAKQVARPIAFGIGIIVIVFIPILTLEGIEGKMFKPMAWTFIFALLGALVLALTLSPVLSYYFLPRKQKHSQGPVERALLGTYSLCLAGALKAKKGVLIAVAALLALTGWQAFRLGGEFLPRLSEGAIAINTIRLAGISVDESTAYNTRIEQLLKKEFPDEIRHVWSRIGTAEVATDPMGTELTDIFVSLNPRDTWTKADNQAELVAAMQAAVADLPGLNIVFTQPIEMRLNEMVSGIRSDIGIKVYGDDFDELVRISDDIQRVLLTVEGATDIAVDQLTGQPTLQVRVDQQAIARYGIPANDVLQFVEAVGGREVGEVFEGQRHFDLVARLPDEHRSDVETLANTIVPTEIGQRLPLRALADIVETEGSATINREWGRRLIRVQCNIAERDARSFIEEAQEKISQTVSLPEGYVIEWGGQFENLERAQNRLMLVVPATLLLVFLLLYFSMKNLRDVLLIYTGIPFALIGGVFALWLRDINFSVSAAVGFIALSGIAVLNGQILVVAIRSFIDEGQAVGTAVINAAQQRLKPVLATAVTDAVGFLPMAISTGVGAEVQRPLATVVIGGVVTSTILTLIVLPILYTMLGKKNSKREDAQ